MAIVKMKKLRVMALAECREDLLGGLQHLGCVEISEPNLSDPAWSALLRRGSSSLAQTRTEIADAHTALAAIKQYAKVKDGLFIQRRQVSEQEFLDPTGKEQAKAVSQKIGGALREISRLQGDEARLTARRQALTPWASLDMPLELEGTAHARFRLMVCPSGTDIGAVRIALADVAAELYEVSADKQQTYVLLLCHRAEEETAQELLRPFNFSAVAFPGTTGTAAENMDALDQSLADNKKAQEAAAAAIVQDAKSRDVLRMYLDQLRAEAEKDASAERLLTDGTILFFEGWAPAESLREVEKLLQSMDCAWEAEDPAPEEIHDVPVRLKNNWLTKPLNMVTEMYSLPAYNNVDPNPLMAPFFILFYGIMMADMGYGLLMFLAGFFISRKYRPKGTMGHLFGLMTLCGVSTFIMGAITGGFFGDFLTQAVLLTTGKEFALPALFTPLDDTLMILLGSMALGLVHIITGMAISFVRKLQNGAVLDAVFEEVTWWVVFLGIGLTALGITNLVLYLGILLVVAGPLITGKGFGKVTGIFASLYNHITGYFGDILSYSRLMALMLAGSVIAQVFNTLGAIPGNIIVFIIISMAGNALNFALNLLGCYVHDLRLQCLEFFNKFYEDGGKPFRPLAMDTKYVDITE
ncbi:V-type ATP synthase subunit I [Dysosmobacter sp. NSJ-60]|uniref:V-type ATP synthase subunit I n=1 Tax=Pusillibacter faecalis TaxID=2714358 RepID=UPI00164E3332|nr:V-type ATP synthase subunit I [Pusillibacter faecalis]MBC5748136.1 V-type ATP synthase subunit I [Dysosmobacter hominis]